MRAHPNPPLRRLVHEVRGLALGETTGFDAGALTVSAEEAAGIVAGPAFERVSVSVASPGESVRIVKVLDAVEPRTKGPGGAGIFPGFCSPALPQGTGDTHVLRGAAVLAAGYLPRAQEAVIDMSGPAAPLSPLAATHNLVVEFEPAQGASWEDVDLSLRRGLLALAARLAEAAIEAEPDHVDELASPVPGSNSAPRIGVVTNLQTQGSFKDVYVYGRSFGGSLPTLLDPNELEDGTVVSGQFGHPSLKNPTYMHQNHPVIAALREREGADLRLAGLVLSPEPVDQSSKELVSAYTAKLCAAAGFDAAIVTKEGGGNADADISLKMDALEDAGISAVGIFAEMAGADGTGPPIVVPPSRSVAMVSTGNYDERLELPGVERAIGGDTIEIAGRGAIEDLILPVAVIYGALSPLGWGRLSCARPAGDTIEAVPTT